MSSLYGSGEFAKLEPFDTVRVVIYNTYSFSHDTLPKGAETSHILAAYT